MNVGLWMAQVLLAIGFAVVGGMKAFMPVAEVAKNMHWVGDVPAGLVRFVGFTELAGALGLILPAATRIQPS